MNPYIGFPTETNLFLLQLTNDIVEICHNLGIHSAVMKIDYSIAPYLWNPKKYIIGYTVVGIHSKIDGKVIFPQKEIELFHVSSIKNYLARSMNPFYRFRIRQGIEPHFREYLKQWEPYLRRGRLPHEWTEEDIT